MSTLFIDGAPASTAHVNLDARRNAASVHLRYPVDTSLVITAFYAEVTAIDDPVTTYYMATGFARGYFGMQVNSPTERRIIFSVWDAASGPTAADRSTVAAENYTQLVAKGDDVEASVFGNEGTGGHSHLVYAWKTGSTQRFFVTAQPQGTNTVYSGWWFHPDRQQWQPIASFRAAKDGQGLRRLYSFSENFGGATGQLRRKAQSPLQQMEHALQGLVAFVIMPIFALANADVSLGTDIGAVVSSPIAIGVALGLLLGKPIGITLASVITVRSGAADLPTGASILAGAIGYPLLRSGGREMRTTDRSDNDRSLARE